MNPQKELLWSLRVPCSYIGLSGFRTVWAASMSGVLDVGFKV